MTTLKKLETLKGWLWWSTDEKRWVAATQNGEVGRNGRGSTIDEAVEARYRDWLDNKPAREEEASKLQAGLDYANGIIHTQAEVCV